MKELLGKRVEVKTLTSGKRMFVGDVVEVNEDERYYEIKSNNGKLLVVWEDDRDYEMEIIDLKIEGEPVDLGDDGIFGEIVIEARDYYTNVSEETIEEIENILEKEVLRLKKCKTYNKYQIQRNGLMMDIILKVKDDEKKDQKIKALNVIVKRLLKSIGKKLTKAGYPTAL